MSGMRFVRLKPLQGETKAEVRERERERRGGGGEEGGSDHIFAPSRRIANLLENGVACLSTKINSLSLST